MVSMIPMNVACTTVDIQPIKAAIAHAAAENATVTPMANTLTMAGSQFYAAEGTYGPIIELSGQSSNEVQFAGKCNSKDACRRFCCSVAACRVGVWYDTSLLLPMNEYDTYN